MPVCTRWTSVNVRGCGWGDECYCECGLGISVGVGAGMRLARMH